MSSCERHGSLAWKRSIWIAGQPGEPAALRWSIWESTSRKG
jgi:hypothetical protein